ncbi:MAG: phosphoglycerate dehydrogenase [Gammaproteobacteria bacterium]|nr:phosphoglycerate dehydrogenase [Gammaproteobacteria bacterium]
MFRIKTINAISPQGLARFDAERFVVGPDLPDPDALVLRSARIHDQELPASLKAVGRAGAGVNNIPVGELSRRGIPVFNAPGANANAVKELVMAGLFIAARNLGDAWLFARGLQGTDAQIREAVEGGKKAFAGVELPGRTLGVVGLGAVGRMVANAGVALGMRVVGFDPELTVEGAWQLSAAVGKAASLDELVRAADFLTLHVPLVESTRKLMDAGRLSLMPPAASLLNFAREEIVDAGAVVAALNSGRLHAYVCDFPLSILRDHPRVVALPHLGASTREAEDNSACMVIDEIKDFLLNGNICHAVNFPDVTMGHEGPCRLAIANANVPNMVGQISTAMAAAGLNIRNLVNKARGEYAYTLVDLDSLVPDAVLARIAAIPGVLSARRIEG